MSIIIEPLMPVTIRMTALLIYTNTSKQVGDPDHLKVFADEAAADEWFRENDKEGVAFAYPVIEKSPAPN